MFYMAIILYDGENICYTMGLKALVWQGCRREIYQIIKEVV